MSKRGATRVTTSKPSIFKRLQENFASAARQRRVQKWHPTDDFVIARGYSAEPPGRTRLRRKWVRLCGGRDCQRRIMSIRLRRLSRATAARRTRRLTGFFTGSLQNFHHGQIARAACGAFAPDDISE